MSSDSCLKRLICMIYNLCLIQNHILIWTTPFQKLGDDEESEQSNFSSFHLHKKVWENHHGNRGCLKTKTHPCVIRRLIWEKVSPLIIAYVADDLCVALCGAVITLPLIMVGSSKRILFWQLFRPFGNRMYMKVWLCYRYVKLCFTSIIWMARLSKGLWKIISLQKCMCCFWKQKRYEF